MSWQFPNPQDLRGLHVVVDGFGDRGFASADLLLERGAAVTVVAPPDDSDREQILGVLGGIRVDHFTEAADVAVATAGHTDLCDDLGIPVIDDLELAWQLRPGRDVAWLLVGGIAGKRTTAALVVHLLRAAGRSVSDSITNPVQAILDPASQDAVVVAVSADQRIGASTVSPWASVCLNADGPDSIDELGPVYQNSQIACVYNGGDALTVTMVERAEVVEGCRAIGITLGIPARSEIGVVEDVIADRAFVDNRETHAQEIATLADLRVPMPFYAVDSLAAIALVRSLGVSVSGMAHALRDAPVLPGRHELVKATVPTRFVNDAACVTSVGLRASLRSEGGAIWIVGGPAEQILPRLSDVLATNRDFLRTIVAFGPDAEELATASRRHAPDVRAEAVAGTDTGVMTKAVERAHALARGTESVILAPGCVHPTPFSDTASAAASFRTAVERLRA